MATATDRFPGLATKGEVVEASKALTHHMKGMLAKALDEMDSMVSVRVGRVLDKALEEKLSEKGGAHDKSFESFKVEIRAEIQSLKSLYESGLKKVEILLESLKGIQVTVPDGAITVTVDQKPSQVTVNVPENSINVAAPKVEVNVPPARRVKKRIEYDGYGRPMEIEEQEVD